MDAPTTAEDAAQRPKSTATVNDSGWISTLRRYLLSVAAASLAWETIQLPLYTIWTEGTTGEITFAVFHCTGGDVLIAGTSLLGALLLFGNGDWPLARHGVVATVTVAAGVAFTVYSEWRNVEVHGNWAYSEWMPTLPVIGTGLSPLAQWIVIPIIAFWWGRRAAMPEGQGHRGSAITGGC